MTDPNIITALQAELNGVMQGNQRLVRERDAAQEDTFRLDWVEKHAAGITKASTGKYILAVPDGQDVVVYSDVSIRGAIDKAIKDPPTKK